MKKERPSRYHLSEFQLAAQKMEKSFDDPFKNGKTKQRTKMTSPTKRGKECPICTQTYDANVKFIVLECNHTCCRNCFQSHIKSKLKQWKDFVCFAENCSAEISPYLIGNSFLSNKEIETVWKICSYSAVNKYQNLKLCPSEKCVGFLNISYQPATCSYCAQKFCRMCLLKEHKGKCQKKQHQRLDQLKFKRCKNCKRPIERTGGCPHMTCPCGHQFCILCAEYWSPGHICPPKIEAPKKKKFLQVVSLQKHQINKQEKQYIAPQTNHIQPISLNQINFTNRINRHSYASSPPKRVDIIAPPIIQNIRKIENIQEKGQQNRHDTKKSENVEKKRSILTEDETNRFILYKIFFSAELKTEQYREINFKGNTCKLNLIILILFLLLFPVDILIKILELSVFIVFFLVRSLYLGTLLFIQECSLVVKILLNIFLLIYCIPFGGCLSAKYLIKDASLYRFSFFPLIQKTYYALCYAKE